MKLDGTTKYTLWAVLSSPLISGLVIVAFAGNIPPSHRLPYLTRFSLLISFFHPSIFFHRCVKKLQRFHCWSSSSEMPKKRWPRKWVKSSVWKHSCGRLEQSCKLRTHNWHSWGTPSNPYQIMVPLFLLPGILPCKHARTFWVVKQMILNAGECKVRVQKELTGCGQNCCRKGARPNCKL